MNYYSPCQRKDGRWDYTCQNNDMIYPVGYCHKFYPLDNKFFPVTEQQIEEHEASKEKYHTDGHETSEEACECYKNYQLDNNLRLGLKNEHEQKKCKICEEWTQLSASVGVYHYFDLCSEHNNRECVEKLYKAPEKVWSS